MHLSKLPSYFFDKFKLMATCLFASALRTNSVIRLLSTAASSIVRKKSNKNAPQLPSIAERSATRTKKSTSINAAVSCPWNDPVDILKGVGVKTKDVLFTIGIKTVGDVLMHFPHSSIDRRHRAPLQDSLLGEIVTFDFHVVNVKLGYRTSPYVITGHDDSGNRVTLTYFFGNTYYPYQWPELAQVFVPGKVAVISGKLTYSKLTSAFDIVNPDFSIAITDTKALEKALVVEPIYGLTSGLTGPKLRKIIAASFEHVERSSLFQYDWIPLQVRDAQQWPSFRAAIVAAHNPTAPGDLSSSTADWKQRLSFDRLVVKELIQSENRHMFIKPENINTTSLLTDPQVLSARETSLMLKAALEGSSPEVQLNDQVHTSAASVAELVSIFSALTTAPSNDNAKCEGSSHIATTSDDVTTTPPTQAKQASKSSTPAANTTDRKENPSISVLTSGDVADSVISLNSYFSYHSASLADIVNDPAFDYMDHTNDALVAMHSLGLDRDEEAVKRETQRMSSYASRGKSAQAPSFAASPIVDLSSDKNAPSPRVILLDLETTGLSSAQNRIIQIAAKVLGDHNSMFNAYVLPVGDSVSPHIAQLTGIHQTFLQTEGVPFRQAYFSFRDWLHLQRKPTSGSSEHPLVLIAHNGKSFDFDFLTVEVQRHNCLEGCAATHWAEDARIDSFVDSLLILRKDEAWLKGVRKPASFAQGKLYKHLLGKELENGHNAMYDIRALEEILMHPTLAQSWLHIANKMQFRLSP